jgi:hypothetical protein
MIKNTLKSKKSVRQEAGVALLTTMLLLFLMSSMLVGFAILLMSNQQLAGSNNDQVQAFYGAEAGMEDMTARLGNLFTQTYSPTIGQINTIQNAPPSVPGISYLNGSGGSGYTITPQAFDALGNPAPTISTIKSGPYVGMTAMATEYTLVVNARTIDGREVKLQRTTQTVGIPMFQFGIFSDTDLSFFPGPNFNFGGRTHTNGNLFLAGGSTLTLSDKVDAYKDIIRTNLENGWSTSNNYTGTVNITTQPGSGNVRALAMTEGSLAGTIGSGPDNNWPNISKVLYSGNLINGQGSAYPALSTGAQKLNLGIVTIGTGTTQAVDLIRRPLSGEPSNVTGERYFAQASLRVLVSDNPLDLMNLPCIDGGTAPFDLSKMATPTNTWATSTYTPLVTLTTLMNNNKVPLIPLAASGAASPNYTGAYSSLDGYWTPSTQGDGTPWPIIKGFIKIEEQIAYGSPCGTWKDVTLEVLSYGYVGRNINPVPQSWDGSNLNPQWPGTLAQMAPAALPNPSIPAPSTAALGFQNPTTPSAWANGATLLTGPSTISAPNYCADPHPLAVIRLERIRDNPSSIPYASGAFSNKKPFNLPVQARVDQACGVDPATGAFPVNWQTGGQWVPSVTDVWPNVLFDTREGTLRDVAMDNTKPVARPTLNGTMHYIELDTKNVASWFGGKLGAIKTTGQLTKDPAVAPNDYVVYISDRRGNNAGSQSITGGWPPLSYTKNETGEYGWTDIVNSPQNPTTGCPNYNLDTGEDENAGTTFAGGLYYYGAAANYIHAAGAKNSTTNPLAPGQIGVFATLAANGLANNASCPTAPSYVTDNIWPMMVAANTDAARQNAPLFFRRAVKIVNGNFLTAVGPCPGGNSCGLTITSENPVYIQGDFNANSGGNGWSDPSIAASVAGDAVTLLSNQWNDVNSFSSPYSTSLRNGNTTWYRVAVIGGATNYFPQPSGSSSVIGQDYGTDGGVHNFLRYIEAWGGTLEYEGSIIDLFYSRQANGTFKCCNTVYSPPSRGYNFDTNFLTPALLPPRTPLFRDINTTGWTRLMLPSQ